MNKKPTVEQNLLEDSNQHLSILLNVWFKKLMSKPQKSVHLKERNLLPVTQIFFNKLNNPLKVLTQTHYNLSTHSKNLLL